jgi:hypothetical protein
VNKLSAFDSAFWLLGVSVVGLVGCLAGDATDEVTTTEAAVSCDPTEWWRSQRDQRQAEVDAYVSANHDDFQWFKDAPVGNAGIPMVMFRLFPELFPDIWGDPDSHFAPVGFAADPYAPQRVLPLGLGFSGSQPPVQTPAGPVNIQVVALTCMGCHAGRVERPDGTVQTIIGAPNTQFSQFRGSVMRTVLDAGYSAERFRAALAAKPAGWLYNDPSKATQEYLERAIFLSPGGAEQFLATLKARALAGGQRFAQTLGAHTYAVPNAPNPSRSTPGYLDAIGAGISIIVDPANFTQEQLRAILPAAPAEIDIMSVWRQDGRPAAQWDGSIVSPLHRNLAAEFGVIGNPAALNMENAVRTTTFTDALPATPYPFDVDEDAAKRGKKLYDKHCASCHESGNSYIFDTDDVGTDANRANMWSPFTEATLGQLLVMSCSDPVACNQEDGTPFAPADVVSSTGGYMAVPLDGIWARAPYLHNGSVPTLHALLTGERPAQFYRGNNSYDQEKVGFTWDSQGPGAALYDTTLSGLANTGHDTTEFNGNVKWKKKPEKLNDLLEYLKTL